MHHFGVRVTFNAQLLVDSRVIGYASRNGILVTLVYVFCYTFQVCEICVHMHVHACVRAHVCVHCVCVCACVCVQLELLPVTSAVHEAYIRMFMTSLRRRAMALIHFVSAET